MSTITAVPYPDAALIRVAVSASDAWATTVSVWRVEADGAMYPVRSLQSIAVIVQRTYADVRAELGPGATYATMRARWASYAAMAGEVTLAIGEDYEAPFNQPVTYLCRFCSASGEPGHPVTSAPVILPWVRTILRDPGHPQAWIAAMISTIPSMRCSIPAAVHRVLGREDPVTIAGARALPEFSMTILTLEDEEADTLRALIRQTAYLMLNGHPAEGGRIWFLAGDVEERRTVEHWCWETSRYWDVECTATGAPVSPIVTESAVWNYQTVNDKRGPYEDYAGWLPAWPSFLSLLRDEDPLTPPPGPPPGDTKEAAGVAGQ
jgi:hypothetical protein